jgi:hypothetical protein
MIRGLSISSSQHFSHQQACCSSPCPSRPCSVSSSAGPCGAARLRCLHRSRAHFLDSPARSAIHEFSWSPLSLCSPRPHAPFPAASSARVYRGGVKGVIFDFAGTIVDFGSCAPVAAFQECFRRGGVPITAAVARGPMGKNKRDHISEILYSPDVAAQWAKAHGNAPSETDVDALYTSFTPIQVEVGGRERRREEEEEVGEIGVRGKCRWPRRPHARLTIPCPHTHTPPPAPADGPSPRRPHPRRPDDHRRPPRPRHQGRRQQRLQQAHHGRGLRGVREEGAQGGRHGVVRKARGEGE